MKNIDNDKIKKFFAEYGKLIIPITLIFVLFIAFLIYYKFSVYDGIVREEKGSFYQYFFSEKYEYNGVVSFNKMDVIVDFTTSDYDIKFDSTPIYYKDKNMVIFPSDVSVVMPTLGCSEYRALKYSYITKSKDNYILTTKKYSDKLGRYFLYDGNDMYFFLDKVTLTVGERNIELSPLSYVIARYDDYIYYYDKDSDVFESINISGDEGYVKNDYYKIFVSLDKLDYFGNNVILSSDISSLSTIDMKG